MPARKKTTKAGAAAATTAGKKNTPGQPRKTTSSAAAERPTTSRRQPAPAKGEAANLAEGLRQLRETTASLAAEVRALRQARPSSPGAAEGEAPPEGSVSPTELESRREGGLPAVVSSLREVSSQLGRSLSEVPRADDFEPLAEHLYEFARTAPSLRQALEEIPKAVRPIEAAVRALQETSETLQFIHESFAESLLRLPRAEDYEPLARPLQEFARVSPLLAESLKQVLAVAAPLADSVRELRGIGQSLEATHTGFDEAVRAISSRPAAAPPAAAFETLAETLAEAVREMEAARDDILEALATLPREPEYARFAANLRELATASPSLMAWLEQIPILAAPLEGSVGRLLAAAARLHGSRSKLLKILEGRGGAAAPEDEE